MVTHAATAAIILNWKRPQNIGAIVRAAHEALPEAPIFVIDHGEGSNSLTNRNDVPRGLCWIRTQANAGAGARVALAARLPFEYYLCIDDDTFLSAGQIRALVAKLHSEPERLHGVIGQRITRNSIGQYRIAHSIRNSCEISVVNQVYAFTHTRALAAMKLAESLGFASWAEVKRGDDILLSSAGSLPSRVHDLGLFKECATKAAEGIAANRTETFFTLRNAMLQKLARRGALYVVPECTNNAEERTTEIRNA